MLLLILDLGIFVLFILWVFIFFLVSLLKTVFILVFPKKRKTCFSKKENFNFIFKSFICSVLYLFFLVKSEFFFFNSKLDVVLLSKRNKDFFRASMKDLLRINLKNFKLEKSLVNPEVLLFYDSKIIDLLDQTPDLCLFALYLDSENYKLIRIVDNSTLEKTIKNLKEKKKIISLIGATV